MHSCLLESDHGPSNPKTAPILIEPFHKVIFLLSIFFPNYTAIAIICVLICAWRTALTMTGLPADLLLSSPHFLPQVIEGFPFTV